LTPTTPVLIGTVAVPAVGHLDHRITGLQLLALPGPGDKNVGLLALASTGSLTVAAEILDHTDEASIQIPTTAAKDEGSLVLVTVDDFPMAGGHCCFLDGAAGSLTNGCGLTNGKPGFLTGCPHGLGNGQGGQWMKHGWSFQRTCHYEGQSKSVTTWP